MLEEPYRWVEAIRNRRDYLEDQLQNASPVVGLAYADGLLLLTTTPGPRKLFEVYNQIAFAAIGHPADIEKLRKGVIDIAHIEAFNLSASDVSLHRLVSFGLGPVMKGAFDEIFRSPFIARVLMAGLPAGAVDGIGADAFYTIDADGSFAPQGRVAAVGGGEKSVDGIVRYVEEGAKDEVDLERALSIALEGWACGRLLAGDKEEPDAEGIRDYLGRILQNTRVEAAVLARSLPTKSKFRLLPQEELEGVLARYR